MADEIKVKCSECGFLAIKTLDSLVVTASESVRTGASHVLRPEEFDPKPFCFISAMRIDEEFSELVGAISDERNRRLRFGLVVNNERACEKFCRWDSIKSPQEFNAMQLQIELAKIADSAKDREEKREDKIRKQEFWEKVVVGVLTAIASGLIGYLLGNSKPATFPTSIILITESSKSK